MKRTEFKGSTIWEGKFEPAKEEIRKVMLELLEAKDESWSVSIIIRKEEPVSKPS